MLLLLFIVKMKATLIARFLFVFFSFVVDAQGIAHLFLHLVGRRIEQKQIHEMEKCIADYACMNVSISQPICS